MTSRSYFEGVDISITESRIFVKLQPDVHSHGRRGCCANACPQRVEKMRDMFRKNRSNRKMPIQLEGLRRKVGAVAHLLSHLQHTRFGFFAYTRTAVQCTVDRSNRNL